MKPLFNISYTITLAPTVNFRMVKLITGSVQWKDVEVVEMLESKFYTKDPQ